MVNKEYLFASRHILLRAIPDGPEDTGRRLHRYWYRESCCQNRIGWQKLCALSWLYLLILAYLSSRSVKIGVNPWLIFCAFLWLINPFNQRNPRLINDLRLRKITYEIIKLFLQNEPNFRKSQINVTDLLIRDYDHMDTWSIRKKQSQTNPNKAKFKKAEMNVTSILTKAYENKPPIRAPKKQSQISLTIKTNTTLFTAKDYEKNRAFGSRQNKPNSKPIKCQNKSKTNPIPRG